MANVYAVKTGNWSDVTVWNTGALPTSADDVFSNNFTVTIDQDVTVLSLRNLAASPIVAGGGFTVSGNFTINATNLYNVGTLLTYTGTGTLNIIANIPNFLTTPTANSSVINITGNGNVNFVGSIIWNAGGSTRYAIQKAGAGKLTITGDIEGNSPNSSVVMINYTAGNMDIIGNITNNHTGSGNGIILNSSIGSINITGNLINNHNVGNGYCVRMSAAGYFKNIGAMINNATTTNSVCFLAIDNINTISIATGPFISSTYAILPFLSYRMWYQITALSYFEFRDSSTNGALSPGPIAPATRLVAPGTAIDAPATSDVRFGVVYASGSQTGTLRVPLPGQVALGVLTDNTTGSAILTAAAIWNTQLNTMTTSGSIGERLSNVATVQTTAAQIAAF
jgi:hypothetical protein